jgi:hypothetical protein
LGDHPRRRSPLRLGPAGSPPPSRPQSYISRVNKMSARLAAGNSNDGKPATESETHFVAIGALALKASAGLADQGATDGTSDNEGEEWQRASVRYGADREFDRDRHQKRPYGAQQDDGGNNPELSPGRNRPMAGPQIVATWANSGVGWSIDGLSTSVARSPQARAGWCGGCGQ